MRLMEKILKKSFEAFLAKIELLAESAFYECSLSDLAKKVFLVILQQIPICYEP